MTDAEFWAKYDIKEMTLTGVYPIATDKAVLQFLYDMKEGKTRCYLMGIEHAYIDALIKYMEERITKQKENVVNQRNSANSTKTKCYIWPEQEETSLKSLIQSMHEKGLSFAEIYFELSKIINIILYEIDIEENL